MRKGIRPRIAASVLAVMIGAIFFAVNPQPASGQEIPPNRKPACTCFCGGPTPDFIAPFSKEEIAAGKCFGGPLSPKDCGLDKLPKAELVSICAKYNAKRIASCPLLAQHCKPEEKKPDCRDPEVSSGRFTRDPFGAETPADIAPSCESCRGGTWKLNIGEISFHPSERQEPRMSGREEVACYIVGIIMFQPMLGLGCSEPIVIPQCVYTYEAIWTCTASGVVRKTTTTKVENGYCIPRA